MNRGKEILENEKMQIIEECNRYEGLKNMVSRGGGVVDMKVKILSYLPEMELCEEEERESFLVVELMVNVGESMGANKTNSLLEYIHPLLE